MSAAITLAITRSWSGAPGTVPWMKALLPFSLVYGALSGTARRRAGDRRRAVPGGYVVAVGNLTVGGSGKSTIARWLALQAAEAGGRAALLLRGHGATAGAEERGIVPDFEGYPLRRAVARYGDEAIAHRATLPREVVVAVDPDRLRAARAVREGYEAKVLVLDDGWEQSGVRWNELWVTVDPAFPTGNGSLLPAGPLRRPVETLREATRIALLLEEEGEEVPESTAAWLARAAPGVPVLRFRRVLRGTIPLEGGGPEERAVEGERIGLVSGVGSPRRLERFARGAGYDVRVHEAFPDHARWSVDALRAAVGRARREGAETIVLTEKDASRWPEGLAVDLPVRVMRTEIQPPDSVEEALAGLREAAGDREPVEVAR